MTVLYQTSDDQLCDGSGPRHVRVNSHLVKFGLSPSQWATEIRRRLLLRREIATLERLSDRTLDDIGVPRSRIPEVARADVERYLTEKLQARAAGQPENGS